MRKNSGFSLIELLIVVAIILILAAIAIPKMLQARMAANESSAVSSLRTITTAQVTYKIANPVYAPDLDALGPANADLLTELLGSAPFQHSGYTFSTTGTADQFTADAVPMDPGVTGTRSFCTSTPASIQYSISGTCDPNTSPSMGN